MLEHIIMPTAWHWAWERSTVILLCYHACILKQPLSRAVPSCFLTPVPVMGMPEFSKACCDKFSRHVVGEISIFCADLNIMFVTDMSMPFNTPYGLILYDQYQLLRPEDMDRFLATIWLTTCSFSTVAHCGQFILAKWGSWLWGPECVAVSLCKRVVPAPLKKDPLFEKAAWKSSCCPDAFEGKRLFRPVSVLVQPWVWNKIGLGCLGGYTLSGGLLCYSCLNAEQILIPSTMVS